jgi:hypothetical protein
MVAALQANMSNSIRNWFLHFLVLKMFMGFSSLAAATLWCLFANYDSYLWHWGHYLLYGFSCYFTPSLWCPVVILNWNEKQLKLQFSVPSWQPHTRVKFGRGGICPPQAADLSPLLTPSFHPWTTQLTMPPSSIPNFVLFWNFFDYASSHSAWAVECIQVSRK